MSYADAAGRGPPQSPEQLILEYRRKLLQLPTYLDIVLLALDPATPKSSRAPAPPEVENITASDTQSLIDVDSPHISSVPSDFTSQSIQTDTQAERIEHEIEDLEKRAEQAAKKDAAAAKSKAKSAVAKAEKNADNPVVVGNVIVVGVMAAVLGTQGYRRWQRDGGLSWNLVGTGAAILAAVGIGDYFVSRWLLQKYPPKN